MSAIDLCIHLQQVKGMTGMPFMRYSYTPLRGQTPHPAHRLTTHQVLTLATLITSCRAGLHVLRLGGGRVVQQLLPAVWGFEHWMHNSAASHACTSL